MKYKLNRRQVGGGLLTAVTTLSPLQVLANAIGALPDQLTKHIRADVVIAGAGLGGCSAALALLRNGLSVVMVEPTDWIGGQLTSQAVPPDEHPFIESHGANKSYRKLREAIRNYYRDNYRLSAEAANQPHFNPGKGSVSRLCCEPKVAETVLRQLLSPYIANRKLQLVTEADWTGAEVDGDRIASIEIVRRSNDQRIQLSGQYYLDASELGDLLELSGTEYVVGAEAKAQTGELHASPLANPSNQQAFTVCFALEYDALGNHTIAQPEEYDFWRAFSPKLNPAWPGKLLDLTYSNPRTLEPKKLAFDPTGASTGAALNLWNYRRIIDHRQFDKDQFSGDISLINWPQNDFILGNLIGVARSAAQQSVHRAKQLSLSLLYWMQTELPRPDGGQGYPGLKLRADIMGTSDGLAKAPYIRESRRIQAELTIVEGHVGKLQRQQQFSGLEARQAEQFIDAVGVGSYPIDLHPSTGGDNYIDFETYPFQLPLRSLIPSRMENLLPACKNIGTTHLTSGCYRLHPIEWAIGEAAGCLAAFAINRHLSPRAIAQNNELVVEFQEWIRSQGVETHWPA